MIGDIMGKKRKMNKEKINKAKVIKNIIKITIMLAIFIISVTYFNKIINTNNKELTISSENIDYFINIADNNSKARKQINWKEIAAIERIQNKRFDTYNQEQSNLIAQSFYDGNGNLISVDSVLEKMQFEAKDKIKVYEIVEKINKGNFTLRTLRLGKNSSKDEFIESLRTASIDNYKKYGVLPSIAIGQAILESDWGESELASNYHNYYGIKADKSWKGAVIAFNTKENYNDKIRANFRAYSTVSESVEDLGKFLTENSRYRKYGFFEGANYKQQAQCLENAGYSTIKNESGDLIYADLLIKIIRENNLMLIDIEAQK